MSKDKHKGVARRKFALANVSVDNGRRTIIRGYLGEPTPTRRGAVREYVDITKEIEQLEKRGLIKRVRTHSRGTHIRRTRLVAR